MKFQTLNRWNNPSELSDLLYLAQLLEELLFDYTLDTYKPSAMNTSLLCREALETIEYAKNGVLHSQNIRHVVDELSVNLRKDPVAKSVITLNIEHLTSVLNNPETPTPELRVTIELLLSDLDLKFYKKKNEELLVDALKSGKGKNEIRTLTRSYVTTLKNLGYHSRFLYDTTREFFHYGQNQITSNDDINEYLALFPLTNKKYVAIYKAAKIFQAIEDSCDALDVSVSDEPLNFADQINQFNFALESEDFVYVLVNEIEARDRFSARELADQRMEVIGTLMTLFHHKQQSSWEDECLVIEVESGSARPVHRSLHPMHKCIDYKPEKAAKLLNSLISNFSLEESSFYKFSRSSELHSLALNSESRENQIINLWIALESLVPGREEKANIRRIIDAVMPFLSLSYVNRLLERFLADLLLWDRKVLHSTLKDISGSSLKSKLVCFLVFDEHSDKREELKTQMRDFHLLRNRFHYLSESLRSPARIRKLLDGHAIRVGWQLRRIYRARNTIVHAGVTPSYTNILIENLHDYLDIVMSTIVKLASDGQKVSSIEQAFKYIDLNYSAYYKLLKSDTSEFSTNEDIESYFFQYAI